MRVLDAGIDSLYWTARAAMGSWFADALRARDAAKAQGRPLPWRDVRGYALDVQEHGRSFYPFVAKAAEFEIRLTDSEKIPTAYVQLRASYIRGGGIERAVSESAAVVGELVGGLTTPRVARIDPYVDVGEFRLRGEDRHGFHTRGSVAAFFDPGEDDWLPSVRVGAKALQVRIYDKRRQLAKIGAAASLSWGDFTGPVCRIEVQALAAALRRFGIDSVADAIASYGDVWRHALTRFFVLRVVGDGDKRTWAVRSEWSEIVEAGKLRFPALGLVPFTQMKGEKLRVLRNLYGNLISLGAFQNCGDLEAVVASLPVELRAVERDRRFDVEMGRRRRRLPLAVRERQPA